MKKKLLLPSLALGVAIAGAAVLHFALKAHEYCHATGYAFSCPSWAIRHRAADWQDPVALIVLFAGIGIAAALYVAASSWPRRVSTKTADRSVMAKLILAFLLVGVGLAGALWLYRHHTSIEKYGAGPTTSSYGHTCGALVCKDQKRSWQDPLALIVMFTGIGAGVALSASAVGWPRRGLRELEPEAEAATEEPAPAKRRGLASIGLRLPASIKLFLAALVIGVALAGALGIHRHSVAEHECFLPGRVSPGFDVGWYCERFQVVVGHRRAAWQDPVALVITIAGIGVGGVLVASALGWPRVIPRRRSP